MKALISSAVLACVLSSPLVLAQEEPSIYQGVDGIVTVSPDPISLAGLRAMEQVKADLYKGLDLIGQIQQSRDFNLNFPHKFVSDTSDIDHINKLTASAE